MSFKSFLQKLSPTYRSKEAIMDAVNKNYRNTMSYQTKKPTDFHIIKPEQQWIPCSKRLPQPNERHGDTSKYYLVQNEFGDMMVARFQRNRAGETWWEQMYAYIPTEDEIVAWMLLPEPYQEEGEN